jgi:hypothetical protein
VLWLILQNSKRQLTANLIDNTYVSQQESSVAVNTFSFGNLTRNNLNFYHFENELCYLNGITIIGATRRPLYFSATCVTKLKVTKITKGYSLIAQQAFSTEKFS